MDKITAGFSADKALNNSEHTKRLRRGIIFALGTAIMLAGCVWTLFNVGSFSYTGQTNAYERSLIDEYEISVDNFMASALEEIYSIKKVYIINDSATVMPVPRKDNFGKASSAEEIAEVVSAAENYGLIEKEDVIFPGKDMPVLDGSIQYYLDETIMSISWKSEIGTDMFNFTEVVVGHPSQFRKYITNNEYSSTVRKTVSAMSQELNTVVGINCDFYAYRNFGVVVYNGKPYRENVSYLDACYVDYNGNLILEPKKEHGKGELAKLVEENNINFSISFGPILVDNFEVYPGSQVWYRLGQAADNYARAAIGQLGELHYLLCTVDGGSISDGEYREGISVPKLAEHMQKMGCEKAYALDGGQSATMTVGGDVFNSVGYGSERPVSDILCFATALPNDN